ncbi:N-acetylglucosamine-1-phosphate uridyltransferase [Fadolivirus algeromassiliense]|jgi:UDP-N-acetylglucosamine diphosphorylase/glucosamine-1-phosphate N-acetyltransferase|uniref:UDP-N-acetylglucosamine diphosphorylase n=1 Tax=Fadolivirus FV1/VV64 TaxID=3070911 RepID=A0A7D3V5F7_9VIRU|nr:N-acetylglucosamine-1-phosphate uridyltransferase [Fadolivirus algeromassiliense]QKF93975.1 N-acetylglucosamine-1-phosphate uridyltransferase [Fadolivirus FV1/VV64]
MYNLVITILAGGLGKRMNSTLPKVLHPVNNIPMIIRILNEIKKLNPSKIIIVVGKFKDVIKSTIELYNDLNNLNIEYALQDPPLGTGHAVLSTLHLLDVSDLNLIVNGDNPLLQYDTLTTIINYFKSQTSKLQITAVNASNPTGSGRIIMENHVFQKIVEEKDCTEEQKEIKIVNCGIYLAYGDVLKKYIPLIKSNNAQKEYYLTDLVEIYKNDNNQISLYVLESNKELEVININTKDQLDSLNNILSTTK